MHSCAVCPYMGMYTCVSVYVCLWMHLSENVSVCVYAVGIFNMTHNIAAAVFRTHRILYNVFDCWNDYCTQGWRPHLNNLNNEQWGALHWWNWFLSYSGCSRSSAASFWLFILTKMALVIDDTHGNKPAKLLCQLLRAAFINYFKSNSPSSPVLQILLTFFSIL